jgi:hypothetical protein
MLSLFIILVNKRHQVFYSTVAKMEEDNKSNTSFFQYLKKSIKSESINLGIDKGTSDHKDGITFTPHPNPSKNEGVLHSGIPVKVENIDFKTRLGSSECSNVYETPILNVDISNYTLLNDEVIGGLNLASDTGIFSLAIQNDLLNKCKNSNVILKFPINTNAIYFAEKDFDHFFEKLASQSLVKAIELVFDQSFDNFYCIRDMMDSKNNAYFNNFKELSIFIKRLRRISNGKPIGLRTGISEKYKFIQLCKTMRDNKVYLDYITIIGEDESKLLYSSVERNHVLFSKLNLEEAVSFASKVIQKFHLQNEIKICAAGDINNGFDLLKLIALGADFCTAIKTQRYFDQISDNYFHDDPEVVVKNNILYSHKNVLRDAVQIMEDVGFSSLENVDPKMFFRRINNSSIKNLEEIYLKKEYSNMVEDFMHLN